MRFRNANISADFQDPTVFRVLTPLAKYTPQSTQHPIAQPRITCKRAENVIKPPATHSVVLICNMTVRHQSPAKPFGVHSFQHTFQPTQLAQKLEWCRVEQKKPDQHQSRQRTKGPTTYRNRHKLPDVVSAGGNPPETCKW